MQDGQSRSGESRIRAFHYILINGVTVEYQGDEGTERSAKARAIDFDDPIGNDWQAVNQFEAVENKDKRSPYVLLFINELLPWVIELKNPTDEDAERSGRHGSGRR